MIHKKSSINSTKPSVAKTTPVGEEEEAEEEEVEEEAVAVVVEAVQDLLPNLSQPARAKLLSQLQQTLEPWARNQQSLLVIAPKQTTSSKMLRSCGLNVRLVQMTEAST